MVLGMRCRRHGWEVAVLALCPFSWLRRAAEAAVGDLEHARTGFDVSAVHGELVFVIYEVGQRFFQGWGMQKVQKMAMSYFQVAEKLSDMDAQQELAFCYSAEATKWYLSDVGLAWI
ncbi:HCP-like protein [Lactarius psammicola]|nr:HCP-like protein [Lactarius psammicola]